MTMCNGKCYLGSQLSKERQESEKDVPHREWERIILISHESELPVFQLLAEEGINYSNFLSLISSELNIPPITPPPQC